jgi:hypothetical protein
VLTRHALTRRADTDGVDAAVVERDYVLAHVVAQLHHARRTRICALRPLGGARDDEGTFIEVASSIPHRRHGRIGALGSLVTRRARLSSLLHRPGRDLVHRSAGRGRQRHVNLYPAR